MLMSLVLIIVRWRLSWIYNSAQSMVDISKYKIIIENQRGSYKSFQTKNDPTWSSYPLKGVTYPVDYGYLDNYLSEDGQDLDIFVGTGELSGYVRIWRVDVPLETKFFINISSLELEEIKQVFAPVLREVKILDEKDFDEQIDLFKTKTTV